MGIADINLNGISFDGDIGAGIGPLIFVGIIILAIAGAIYNYYAAKRRREELRKFSRRMGLTFTPGKDYYMDNRFGLFKCLCEGSRRYAHNTMTGQLNGREIVAFDYHYETYSRDSKGRRQTHHHYFSALILNTALPLKPLFIRPEGFFDKVTEFFGYDDIDFELNEFSNKFYVKAADRKWAFDVIHQETMEFLLNCPSFTLDFQGPFVMAYRKSRFSPQEFEEAFQVTEGVIDRLPQYLIKELQGVDA